MSGAPSRQKIGRGPDAASDGIELLVAPSDKTHRHYDGHYLFFQASRCQSVAGCMAWSLESIMAQPSTEDVVKVIASDTNTRHKKSTGCPQAPCAS
jgi:hypothetical protein